MDTVDIDTMQLVWAVGRGWMRTRAFYIFLHPKPSQNLLPVINSTNCLHIEISERSLEFQSLHSTVRDRASIRRELKGPEVWA